MMPTIAGTWAIFDPYNQWEPTMRPPVTKASGTTGYRARISIPTRTKPTMLGTAALTSRLLSLATTPAAAMRAAENAQPTAPVRTSAWGARSTPTPAGREG